MEAPGQQVQVAGTSVTIPPAELLAVHAAVHGTLASGPTDLMQSALDISAMRNSMNEGAVLFWARRAGALADIVEIESRLAAIDGRGPGLLRRRNTRIEGRARRITQGALTSPRQARTAWALVRQRDVGPQARSAVDDRFPGHPLTYRTWLRLGRFSALERWAVRRWGGFLQEPSDIWSNALTLEPFRSETSGVTASPVAATVLDWRFRVRMAQPWSHAAFVVRSDALDKVDALVYVNGVPITRLVAGGRGTHTFELRGVGPSAEFSIRTPGITCSECFGAFTDLRLSVSIA